MRPCYRLYDILVRYDCTNATSVTADEYLSISSTSRRSNCREWNWKKDAEGQHTIIFIKSSKTRWRCYVRLLKYKMALLCSAAIRAAPLRLCFYLLFYLLLISIFTHITSALITYDKSALLDIGNRFTNLVQDTLSPNPSWPLEILRNAENKGHRRRNKKHRGKSAGIRNRLRKSAHSPPLPSLCSLMSNPWIIRWTILEPGLVSNGT